MRKVLFAIVLACSLCPMMQCSGIETLSGFDGKVVVVESPFIKSNIELPLYRYTIQTDSIRWLYDYEPGKDSRVSIIASGKFKKDSIIIFSGDDATTAIIDSVLPLTIEQTDLNFGIETYFDSIPSIAQAKINPDGTFLDTISIFSSSNSELILTQSSRLCATIHTYSDTVPLTNPHSIK